MTSPLLPTASLAILQADHTGKITSEESQPVCMQWRRMKNPHSLGDSPRSPPHFPLYFILIFIFFRAKPMAYGSSQARGQIRAAGASLRHSHSNARPKLHLQPTPQLIMAQRVKDSALSLLWYEFNPWPMNFHMPWAWPKK